MILHGGGIQGGFVMYSMKNIKPSYAVNLGKGEFVGAKFLFVCKKCGRKVPSDDKWSPDMRCEKGGYCVFVRNKL